MSAALLDRPIWPKRIYVTEDAAQDPLTKRVLSRLPDREVVKLSERKDPISELKHHQPGLSESERFTQGKRELLLTRHRGGWLEHCPGTSEHVCCNLWTVNPGEGCPLDCTYCYLQSYLRRNPTMKLFTNTWEMFDEIEKQALSSPSRLFRVCTGEVMDSLVWDELTDFTCELVPFFARIPNLMLELKSKFASIQNLLDMRDVHQGKTVVSWSVNAPHVSAKDEAFTATLDERIEAAGKVVEAGYRVGFHFDPVVQIPNFEDGYRDTINKIFSVVDPTRVAWISISTLRYRREMQRIMTERFPESQIPFGEQLLAKDDKMRYAQPIRFRMIRFIWDQLRAINSEMPIYMCMESSAAWKEFYGGAPAAGSELVEVFSKRGRLPILSESECSSV